MYDGDRVYISDLLSLLLLLL